jgi:hypothetical protein
MQGKSMGWLEQVLRGSWKVWCKNKILIFYFDDWLTVHRSFLTGAQDSRLQRVAISVATYIQLRNRPPEDEQSNARNM